jgi:hypothetical protein
VSECRTECRLTPIVEQLELELDRSTLLWRLVRCRGEWGLRVHGYVLLHEIRSM